MKRQPAPHPPVLIDIRTTAARLGGLSLDTVRRMTRNGELHAVKIGGRVFYVEDEITRYVERRMSA